MRQIGFERTVLDLGGPSIRRKKRTTHFTSISGPGGSYASEWLSMDRPPVHYRRHQRPSPIRLKRTTYFYVAGEPYGFTHLRGSLTDRPCVNDPNL